jgi:hypothetical protein
VLRGERLLDWSTAIGGPIGVNGKCRAVRAESRAIADVLVRREEIANMIRPPKVAAGP